jgi:hypothetical protein
MLALLMTQLESGNTGGLRGHDLHSEFHDNRSITFYNTSISKWEKYQLVNMAPKENNSKNMKNSVSDTNFRLTLGNLANRAT